MMALRALYARPTDYTNPFSYRWCLSYVIAMYNIIIIAIINVFIIIVMCPVMNK